MPCLSVTPTHMLICAGSCGRILFKCHEMLPDPKANSWFSTACPVCCQMDRADSSGRGMVQLVLAGMRLQIVFLTQATPATSLILIWSNFHPLCLGASFSIPGGLTANQVLYLLLIRPDLKITPSPVSKETSGFFYFLQSNLIPSRARIVQTLVMPGGQMLWQSRPCEQQLLLPAVGLDWIHLGTRGGEQAISHQDTQADSCHRTASRCRFGAQSGLDSTLFQSLFSPQSTSTNHWQ